MLITLISSFLLDIVFKIILHRISKYNYYVDQSLVLKEKMTTPLILSPHIISMNQIIKLFAL